ncbi:MAG: DUF3786 domain-containing protein [Bacillota bacterium]|nr:DUF3786 domain-containing protein [Bacillota bacterium]
MDERGKMGIAFDKYLADFLAENGKKMAELSGGQWEDPLIRLPYLGGSITINHKDGTITPEPKELLEKILIYKYLLEVQGIEGPGDDFIAFIQLPCGSHHQKFFKLEVLAPLQNRFGEDLLAFTKAAKAFGGFPVKGGDLAYQIPYFPKIQVRIQIWEGDDEFPAQSAFLFDNKCHFHMDTDGLNELANHMTALLLEEADR